MGLNVGRRLGDFTSWIGPSLFAEVWSFYDDGEYSGFECEELDFGIYGFWIILG